MKRPDLAGWMFTPTKDLLVDVNDKAVEMGWDGLNNINCYAFYKEKTCFYVGANGRVEYCNMEFYETDKAYKNKWVSLRRFYKTYWDWKERDLDKICTIRGKQFSEETIWNALQDYTK